MTKFNQDVMRAVRIMREEQRAFGQRVDAAALKDALLSETRWQGEYVARVVNALAPSIEGGR